MACLDRTMLKTAWKSLSLVEKGQKQFPTDELAAPATPVKLLTPALVTREDICLQARAMLLSTVASSESRVPFASSCMSITKA